MLPIARRLAAPAIYLAHASLDGQWSLATQSNAINAAIRAHAAVVNYDAKSCGQIVSTRPLAVDMGAFLYPKQG